MFYLFLVCTRAVLLGDRRAVRFADSNREYFNSYVKHPQQQQQRQQQKRPTLDEMTQLALKGSCIDIEILRQEQGEDLYWTILSSAVHGDHNTSRAHASGHAFPPLPRDPRSRYECGVLRMELAAAGVPPPRFTCGQTEVMLLFARSINECVRRAIDTWVIISTRLRVVKDIRRVISELIWKERADWAELVENNSRFFNRRDSRQERSRGYAEVIQEIHARDMVSLTLHDECSPPWRQHIRR